MDLLPAPIAFDTAVLYFITFVVGVAFGIILEMAGFGKSTTLASQFYLTNMTVFKVMFTAIITAMVLIFGATGLGLLDYSRIWVNPTYLWPGIVGGLIMGVGFVIGGFCPGTSLAALSTGKKDAIFFAGGLMAGIYVFGETVDNIATFWNSSYLGRFTLPELFGLPTGVVVFGIVIMALGLFWGAEKIEQAMGAEKPPQKLVKRRLVGAGTIAALALAVLLIGQPTLLDKWQQIAPTEQARLDNRDVQIHPAELLEFIHNDRVDVVMIDVRDERDFNLFHIQDAVNYGLQDLPEMNKDWLQKPSNTLFVTMSNDEDRATDAYKMLVADSLANVYILEGGINYWLDTYNVVVEDEHGQDHAAEEGVAVAMLMPTPTAVGGPASDVLRYDFPAALGDRYAAAYPDPHNFELEYTPKIEMVTKQASGGG